MLMTENDLVSLVIPLCELHHVLVADTLTFSLNGAPIWSGVLLLQSMILTLKALYFVTFYRKRFTI